MKNYLQIKNLCEQTHSTPETIRFYEKIGLLPAPIRAANGYRLYTQDTVVLLNFIKACRELGFSVEETARFTELYQQQKGECVPVNMLVQKHYQDIQEKIAKLQEIERFLFPLMQCEKNDDTECEALKGISTRAEQH